MVCTLYRHQLDPFKDFYVPYVRVFLRYFNPNFVQVGKDGSVPLMVCLVPLINKDPLHHFTHTMKVGSVCYGCRHYLNTRAHYFKK